MSLAVAALITAIIWLIINEINFRELRFSTSDWIYIFFLLVIYLTSGLLLPAFVGLAVYLTAFFVASLIFMKPQFLDVFSMITKVIEKKFGKTTL